MLIYRPGLQLSIVGTPNNVKLSYIYRLTKTSIQTVTKITHAASIGIAKRF